MELFRIDTKRAYQQIRERIVKLQMAPGEMINEQALAQELGTGVTPVREALKMLAYGELVDITQRHGLYVAKLDTSDLEQISEMRLTLETLSARLAAERVRPDDMAVLEALRKEQAITPPEDTWRQFELDHKFHQAVANATQNKYLARTLERFFGLSQRLWYLALPRLVFLPSCVETHLDLVEAIESGDGDRAARIMYDHVAVFYDQIRVFLQEKKE
ncbi:MAG: GntR family transcriptional regulator [Anaerolineales bacterium]|nr:GntR family transcriptional regulator [Anaerolineales bacterium]